MAQHDYVLEDALGSLFRADLNNLASAIQSNNSHATAAPTAAVQGMDFVKTVSATVQEVYQYDGTNWVLRAVFNPTTHEFRSVDGVRRTYGGSAGGTADALTVSTTPAATAYEDGQITVVYTGAGANTGAMTLNRDALGVKAMKINGADPAAGDVPANSMLVCVYRSNIQHIIGGSLVRATTARYGNVKLSTEATFLAGTAGEVPTSDVIKKHAREKLYANRTYYVRADGNDSNTGLVDSAGGAFLTLQGARAVIRDGIDLNGFNVTVQVKDGTYTGGYIHNGLFVGQTSASQFTIQGNSGTPGNVIISTTAAIAITADNAGRFVLKDMELRTTTSGEAILCDNQSYIGFSNIRFGVCAGFAHVIAQRNSILEALGNYSIVGACARHINAQQNATVDIDNITITITGTPAFSSEFVRATNCANVDADNITFSGSATGQRYDVSRNAVIDTSGGGANYFPGNSAGTDNSGSGQYA